MKRTVFLLVALFLISVSIAFAQGSEEKNSRTIVASAYNLRVKIPPGWFSISNENPHFIASVASAENPQYEDTRYGFYLAVLGKGFGLNDLMDKTAKGKASITQQKNLIKLGEQEEVEVAGLRGTENLYLFSVAGHSCMYAVVGFEKDGIGYIADYWTPRDNKSRIEFQHFREWLKVGISFLDPAKNISEKVKIKLKTQDQTGAAGNKESNNSIVQKMLKKLGEKPDSRGYVALGMVYANAHDYENAEKAYKKAIEIDPKYAHGYEALGVFYGEQGHFEKSVQVLEKAVELNPKDGETLNNLAGTYLMTKQYDKMIQTYQAAIALEPSNKMRKLRLGQAYMLMGDLANAESAVNNVLKEDPHEQTAILLLRSIRSMSSHAKSTQNDSQRKNR